jgi:hypothetical protein
MNQILQEIPIHRPILKVSAGTSGSHQVYQFSDIKSAVREPGGVDGKAAETGQGRVRRRNPDGFLRAHGCAMIALKGFHPPDDGLPIVQRQGFQVTYLQATPASDASIRVDGCGNLFMSVVPDRICHLSSFLCRQEVLVRAANRMVPVRPRND